MITATAHFSFSVSDLEAALHFFCDQLGLHATPIEDVTDANVRQIVGFPDAHLRISIVHIPDGRIELIQYVQPAGQTVDSTTSNPGAAHIAFQVDDVQKMYEGLSAQGIKFVNPPAWGPGPDGTGLWGVSYFKGPDGITVEVMQQKS
ncbi:MAG: VOC family protein [Acidobacteriota bacterium]|jgi:lactoylglutathione lyase|nr:VOC family protein [Acidobacteriota bacterium]